MRLLLGEPGSGKTTRILAELREAGAGLLVVPTATMAEHLRHELARAGSGVAPSSVATLAGFTSSLVPGAETCDAAGLALLIDLILASHCPPAYSELSASPGFAPALARVIEDLAGAGCDANQWAALESLGVHRMAGFSAIYDSVDASLARHGLALRAAQIASAAALVRRDGVPHRRIWLDGFFQLSPGELELLRALKDRADVTVALPEWAGAAATRDALVRMGCHQIRLHRVRPQPRVIHLAAPSREREAEEIALRILEHRRSGRPWREMGVVVRAARPYAPLLETTFARSGIPCRSYFSTPLSGHAAPAFFTRVIEAALSGWEASKTLRALRSPVALCGLDPGADQLESTVRQSLPCSGLDTVPGARHWFGPFEHWTADTATPGQWASRLAGLASLIAPPRPEPSASPSAIRVWQARAAALRAWQDSLQAVARLLPPDPLLLEGFWRWAERRLSETGLRVNETRRDVVHILDAVEARQWELPVVFVCGLVEGEFPRPAQPDPVLPEAVRIRLRENGVMVRTRAERELEEQFLLRIALTRASSEVVLCSPEFDEKGRPNLRSFALDAEPGQKVPARRIAFLPAFQPPLPPRPALQDDAVLAHVRDQHARQRPTAIEVFLQCPYQFFASRTLKLAELPALPADRLDSLVLGTLVHSIIAAWHRREGSLEEVFESCWRRELRARRIPPSHRVQVARSHMMRSLRLYIEDAHLRPGWTVAVEQPLQLPLDNVAISGRADRVDTSPEGAAVVFDFKYSGSQNVRKKLGKQDEGLLVQGGLYLAALARQGLTPAGFYFTGVRGETSWHGSEEPADVAAYVSTALSQSRLAIERIAQGDISVKPADEDACQYCAFLHVCRIQESSWLTQKEQSASQ